MGKRPSVGMDAGHRSQCGERKSVRFLMVKGFLRVKNNFAVRINISENESSLQQVRAR